MRLTRDRLIKLIRWNNHVAIDEKRFVVGFAGDQAELCKPSSFLIGGLPDMGKTHILSYLACQAVILGGRLLFIDPHGNEGSHGLMSKVSSLRPWFADAPIDAEDSEASLATLLQMEQELHQREAKGGMVGKQLLFLFIDEFNEFLSRFEKDDLATVNRILSVLGRGGRKFGLYLILCGHNWTLSATGAVRKAVGGRICVNCERGDMAMVMDVEQKFLTPFTMTPLSPGDAVVKHPRKGLMRLRYPLTNREQVAPLANLVRETVGLPRETYTTISSTPQKSAVSACETQRFALPLRLLPPRAAAYEAEREAITEEEADMSESRLPFAQEKSPSAQGRNAETAETVKRLYYEEGMPHRDIAKVVRMSGAKYKTHYQPLCEALGIPLQREQPITPLQWQAMKRQSNSTCLACHKPESEVGPLEKDHIVPRTHGGPSTPDNIQPLCKLCNSSKGERTIDYRTSAASSLGESMEPKYWQEGHVKE